MGRLGLGCVQLGSVRAGMDVGTSIRLVRHAIDSGITWFDTADVYTGGTSELILGRALRGRRDGVQIATKGGYVFNATGRLSRTARLAAATAMRLRPRDRVAATGSPPRNQRYGPQDFDPRYLSTALDASLRRLRTDHIDVYMLHGFDAASVDHPLLSDELAQWALDVRQAGKIGRFGVAAETTEQAMVANRCPDFTATMVPYGLLDPDCGTTIIPEAHANGRTVIARGVLGAGLIGDVGRSRGHPKSAVVARVHEFAAQAGVEAVQLALWFVARRADVDVIIAGASSRRHIDELTRWFMTAPPRPGFVEEMDSALGSTRPGSDAA